MEVAHVFEHYIVSSPYGIALDAVVVFSWGFYFLIHNLSGHAVINFKETGHNTGTNLKYIDYFLFS